MDDLIVNQMNEFQTMHKLTGIAGHQELSGIELH